MENHKNDKPDSKQIYREMEKIHLPESQSDYASLLFKMDADTAIFYVELQPDVLIELNYLQVRAVTKTLSGWRASSCENICDYLYPGDTVDKDIYEYFLNILPPRHDRHHYLQLMTPFDDAKNEKGEYHPVYMTFEAAHGCWHYIGHCFNDEFEHQTELFSKTLVQPVFESRRDTNG